jgi:hypothetical protein
MPLQATSGAASYDGFGGGPAAVPNYIEDVFSTWLYAGNASTQTITNGIDLSTKGGLVWTKNRSLGGTNNALQDTVRGRNNILFSNTDAGNQAYSTSINSFNTTGYTLGSETLTNQNGETFVSWTFREQAKFFDVVTYTGTGSARTVSHNLGSVPGCIIVKRTNAARDWTVYHRSLGATKGIYLNSTAAEFTSLTALWNGTEPTSTEFSVGTNTDVNASGSTYVAYIFAHNAGGFGLTGTDNVISCGSYAGNSGSNFVSLGWEPQFILLKKYTSANSTPTLAWLMFDNMRGVATGQTDSFLNANDSGAENYGNNLIEFNATGFTLTSGSSGTNASGDSYIYIAIRRGPMKTPTTGTSVFNPSIRTGTGLDINLDGGITFDVATSQLRNVVGSSVPSWFTRLTGGTLFSSGTSAQRYSEINSPPFNTQTTVSVNTTNSIWNGDGTTSGTGVDLNYVNYFFRRAPGFMDVVCYTGTGSATTFNHNLGVAPELMIVKRRDATVAWQVYSAALANTEYLVLNTTAAKASGTTRWNSTTPTASVFTIGTDASVNASGGTYVAYLFASCPGVSKVGSYTGTGALQTINCGFTGGARFVLIKRTDSTGDWFVYDSARGISSGNDPYLLLNSSAVEVTGTNYVDTTSVGFQVTAAAPAGLNANGGTYVFLAIA